MRKAEPRVEAPKSWSSLCRNAAWIKLLHSTRALYYTILYCTVLYCTVPYSSLPLRHGPGVRAPRVAAVRRGPRFSLPEPVPGFPSSWCSKESGPVQAFRAVFRLIGTSNRTRGLSLGCRGGEHTHTHRVILFSSPNTYKLFKLTCFV